MLDVFIDEALKVIIQWTRDYSINFTELLVFFVDKIVSFLQNFQDAQLVVAVQVGYKDHFSF
jgi:hypothetical protein